MLKLKNIIFLLLVFLLVDCNVFAAPDTVKPVSTISSNPSSPNGENGWFITYPNLTISSEDSDSGISNINWRLNNGPWESRSFFSGLNLVQNPSFENGHIQHWNFQGSFPSAGVKSSFRKRTGNFSAVIISIGSGSSFWKTTSPMSATSLTNYTYSFYATSFTSWLDNGFYEVVLVDNGNETVVGQESIVISENDLDLKLNFKKYSGTFTLGSVSPNAYLYIKIGILGAGHMGIEDAYLSKSGADSSVNFTLSNEGENTLQFYAIDGSGNIENIKSANINIDTVAPAFSGFETFNQEGLQKFSSRLGVSDATSNLVSSPSLFNYAVDGFTDGFYENPSSCSGEFIEGDYLDLSTDYATGSTSGTVSTSQIDYCDTNWINCKKLNFYVKDIAGNIGNRSICINGPYITTLNGNVFGRNSIYQMGLGDIDNVWGVATSAAFISDISSTNDYTIQNYTSAPYLNTAYSTYIDLLRNDATVTDSLTNSDGLYLIEDSYNIDNSINYTNASQVVFIDGSLNINENIISNNSSVIYLVNGSVNIIDTVTQMDVYIISTNQIFTSNDISLAPTITINGGLVAQNLVFNRNTDRTQGASEIINMPISIYFNNLPLELNNIYWREIVD